LPQFNIIETATEKTVKVFEAPEECAMTIAADWSRGTAYDVGDLKVVEMVGDPLVGDSFEGNYDSDVFGFAREDRGDHDNYQMYSKEGNDACEDAVAGIVRAAESMRGDERLTRELVIDWIRNAHKAVRAMHPEVRDTEPASEIVYQVNVRVCGPNSIQPIDRFEV
jgi:hypothetical protein